MLKHEHPETGEFRALGSAALLVLQDEEQAVREELWARRHSSSQALAMRCKITLACAEPDRGRADIADEALGGYAPSSAYGRFPSRSSAGRGSTTSPMPSASTATSSGAFPVAAGLSSPRDHALCSLLALNGVRISEALGADISNSSASSAATHPGRAPQGRQARHHPTRSPAASALDLVIGERLEGPLFLGLNGERMTREAAAGMVRRIAKAAGAHMCVDGCAIG